MTKEQTMSVLRMRMIEDMKLAGLSAKTQEVYLQAVIALVKHYGNRSPDRLTEEEVRRYLLEVRERNARGTFKARHYGIQFFYRNTLGKDWALFKKRSGSLSADALSCIDQCFIADEMLDRLPLASQVGKTRVGGIDLNKPRMRHLIEALIALSPSPNGFAASEVAARDCASH